MNTLQKCIGELKKEQPDIRYILGMLETYLELSGHQSVTPVIKSNTVTVPYIPSDEEVTDIQRKYDNAPIGKVT